MILQTRGKVANLEHLIVGKISVNKVEKDAIVIINDLNQVDFNHLYQAQAILTTFTLDSFTDFNLPIAYSVKTLEHLSQNDIIVLNVNGVINTLYRERSNHNFLFLTERCNSNCLMCSQPPKDRDDTAYFYEINSKLIKLIPKDQCETLGITGGEPTLLGERFFLLIKELARNLPTTYVQCLTNGRSFAWSNLAQKLHTINHNNLLLAIPLYADIPEIHDYIVQAQGAFNQTIKGIYNLARYNQRIEIRIVLHKISIVRLKELAQFIYKNMPFIEHIALMGLEMEGYTPYNIDKLWIDPYDYQEVLKEVVHFLNDFGMNVSIYNIPLCLLPEDLWRFSVKSISDWKNIYFDDCATCTKLNECGGLFKSSIKKSSGFIKPFI